MAPAPIARRSSPSWASFKLTRCFASGTIGAHADTAIPQSKKLEKVAVRAFPIFNSPVFRILSLYNRPLERRLHVDSFSGFT
jgi:hypothetical protein